MAAPVERKVKFATLAATVFGGLVALLNWLAADSDLLGALPDSAQALILLVAPPLGVFWAAWQTKHTPRPADPPGGVQAPKPPAEPPL